MCQNYCPFLVLVGWVDILLGVFIVLDYTSVMALDVIKEVH